MRCVSLFFVFSFGTLCCVCHADYCKTSPFKNCVCTDELVECHDETNLVNITDLYSYIKDNITKFEITGSNFPDLPTNFLGSCRGDTSLVLKKLDRLTLSRNNIKSISGKSFHCMNHLTYMDLSHNSWRIDYHPDQIGYFTSLPVLQHLDLTNAFDEVWNGSIHFVKLASIFENTDMSNLLTLKLGYNELFTLSEAAANSFCELTMLQELDLSHNNLSAPSLPTRDMCMENLKVLNLSNNYMPNLPAEFIGKIDKLINLEKVDLDQNQFVCDCHLRDTWLWLNSTKTPIMNKDQLKCRLGYHSSYIGKPILSLKVDDLLCQTIPEPSNVAIRAVTGIIFTVIAITVVALLIVNRHKVASMCRGVTRKMPKIRMPASHSGYATVNEVNCVENV